MRRPSEWFEPRVRAPGMLAFMLHRITGLGLVFYLFLHLVLLNQLRQGAEAWDGFLRVMRSPWVTALDAVLLLGILIHGLNGLRLTLVGFGLFVRQQKVLFWGGLAAAVVVSAVGMAMMLR